MYTSTRGNLETVTAAEAIKKGIAADGGLFVPTDMPDINKEWLANLIHLDYKGRAFEVLRLFLTDYDEEELKSCIAAAYTSEKFDEAAIAPVVAVDKDIFVLELWHGPTSAFKDMALQMLPQLMSKAIRKTREKSEIIILTATSGDTGKAALEGFTGVGQIKIVVFYPEEGISPIQRLQMVTQEGDNVLVVAVRGNFDDAQTGVKKIFTDSFFNKELAANGYQLSSANSINWGRLVPQIVYYFSAYADLMAKKCLLLGQPVNFVVPTGNFGNLLAGYYAKRMGLPIGKLICASNGNNVVAEFLQCGIYDKVRAFHKTLSPSMDILISSNLERLLYHITKKDCLQVGKWMEELTHTGRYSIGKKHTEKIRELFWADWVGDQETLARMENVFETCNYLVDPHTAVAWEVGERYRRATGDKTPQIIVSTASPFKFNESVLTAISPEYVRQKDEFFMLRDLSRLSGWPVPTGLAALEQAVICHEAVCDKEQMSNMIRKFLNKMNG